MNNQLSKKDNNKSISNNKKYCAECGELKELSEFFKGNNNEYFKVCKNCINNKKPIINKDISKIKEEHPMINQQMIKDNQPPINNRIEIELKDDNLKFNEDIIINNYLINSINKDSGVIHYTLKDNDLKETSKDNSKEDIKELSKSNSDNNEEIFKEIIKDSINEALEERKGNLNDILMFLFKPFNIFFILSLIFIILKFN